MAAATNAFKNKNTVSGNSQSGALIVCRLDGQTVQIGDDIFVTLLDHTEHSGARLRVQAPLDMAISRRDQID